MHSTDSRYTQSIGCVVEREDRGRQHSALAPYDIENVVSIYTIEYVFQCLPDWHDGHGARTEPPNDPESSMTGLHRSSITGHRLSFHRYDIFRFRVLPHPEIQTASQDNVSGPQGSTVKTP